MQGICNYIPEKTTFLTCVVLRFSVIAIPATYNTLLLLLQLFVINLVYKHKNLLTSYIFHVIYRRDAFW
jgi:hypothetical protein